MKNLSDDEHVLAFEPQLQSAKIDIQLMTDRKWICISCSISSDLSGITIFRKNITMIQTRIEVVKVITRDYKS